MGIVIGIIAAGMMLVVSSAFMISGRLSREEEDGFGELLDAERREAERKTEGEP